MKHNYQTPSESVIDGNLYNNIPNSGIEMGRTIDSVNEIYLSIPSSNISNKVDTNYDNVDNVDINNVNININEDDKKPPDYFSLEKLPNYSESVKNKVLEYDNTKNKKLNNNKECNDNNKECNDDINYDKKHKIVGSLLFNFIFILFTFSGVYYITHNTPIMMYTKLNNYKLGNCLGGDYLSDLYLDIINEKKYAIYNYYPIPYVNINGPLYSYLNEIDLNNQIISNDTLVIGYVDTYYYRVGDFYMTPIKLQIPMDSKYVINMTFNEIIDWYTSVLTTNTFPCYYNYNMENNGYIKIPDVTLWQFIVLIIMFILCSISVIFSLISVVRMCN